MLRRRNFTLDESRWDDLGYLRAVFKPMLAGIHTALMEGRKPGSPWAFLKPMTPVAWVRLTDELDIVVRSYHLVLQDIKNKEATLAHVQEIFTEMMRLAKEIESA